MGERMKKLKFFIGYVCNTTKWLFRYYALRAHCNFLFRLHYMLEGNRSECLILNTTNFVMFTGSTGFWVEFLRLLLMLVDPLS